MGLFNKSSKKDSPRPLDESGENGTGGSSGEQQGAVGVEESSEDYGATSNPARASRIPKGFFSKTTSNAVPSSNPASKARPFGLGRKQADQEPQRVNQGPIVQQRLPRTAATISDTIGRFCGLPYEDWNGILDLADVLSTSDQASREAVETIRQEVKHGSPVAQERAIRLLVVLTRNTSDRFKLRIADKKFLKTIETIYKSNKTDHTVQSAILKSVGILTFENQHDADLQPVNALYINIKPSDAPINGFPQDENDTSFNPITTRAPRRRQFHPHSNSFDPKVQVEQVLQRASVAKAEAGMLQDSLAYTPAEELGKNEIVQEFYAKVLAWQDFVSQQLPWAQAEADKASRAKAEAAVNGADGQSPNGNQPLAEEKMVNALLEANSEINEALAAHHRLEQQATRREQEDAELRLAQERSKVETRYDPSREQPYQISNNPYQDNRHSGEQQDETGHLRAPMQPVASGSSTSSRSASPVPVAHVYDDDDDDQGGYRNPNPSGSSPPPVVLQSRNPYARLSQEPESPVGGLNRSLISTHLVEEPEDQGEAYGGTQFPTATTSPSRNPFSNTSAIDRSRKDSEEIVTPREPSAKALGKLRRVSGLEVEVEEQQRKLEEQLRQRYQQGSRSSVASPVPQVANVQENGHPNAMFPSGGSVPSNNGNAHTPAATTTAAQQRSVLDDYDPFRAY